MVWELCDGTHTMDDIIQALSELFPDAKGKIPGDTARILEELKVKKLLE